MHSRQILIVYGTKYGQTAKIARRLAEIIMARGEIATTINADGVPSNLVLTAFDGVIVGGSVIAGKHQRSVRRFVLDHRDALDSMPCAFFSVSASAGSSTERGRADAQRCIDEFLRDTGWRPDTSQAIAGAIEYRKYNPLLRWFMKQISKRNGGPTDTSRDYELTDWSEVQRFVDRFVTMLRRHEVVMVVSP
jgi:menaquinone-dependent protoporphyrinogen oxidase